MENQPYLVFTRALFLYAHPPLQFQTGSGGFFCAPLIAPPPFHGPRSGAVEYRIAQALADEALFKSVKRADQNLALPVVCSFEPTSFFLSDIPAEILGSQPSQAVAPVRPPCYLEATAILHAASDRTRWLILKELSKRQPLAIRELSKITEIYPGLLSNHIAVLREAGAITIVPGADARHRYHTLAPDFIPQIEGEERVLDFGSCVLRFPIS